MSVATKTPLLSSRELQLRGWSKETIKKLLKGRKQFTQEGLDFFMREDALAQEKTPYFLENKEDNPRLVEAEMRRLKFYVERHKALRFSILTFKDEISLYREAIRHYNKATGGKLKLHRNIKMEFLSRIVVNMLRHTCIEYIEILSSITSERTRSEIYYDLKRQVNIQILQKYQKIGKYYNNYNCKRGHNE